MENKKAQLVVIVHDVDPIKMVVFLPVLCCKMGVPYCITPGQAGVFGPQEDMHHSGFHWLSMKTKELWLSW